MVEALDMGNYNETGLVEIKLPMHMPYGPNQLEYERWDGEIEIEGIHYNYVKRKIYNDTLYLFCIPNINKTELHNAKTTLAQSAADVSDNNKNENQSSPLLKKLLAENEYDQPFAILANNPAQPLFKSYNSFCVTLFTTHVASSEKPPEYNL